LIIDAHVNPPIKEFLIDPYGDLIEYSAKFFKTSITPVSVEKMLADYQEAAVDKLILHNVNTSNLKRGKTPPNDALLAITQDRKEKLYSLCAVDLSNPEVAKQELERTVRNLQCLGLKLSPMIQGVAPNDRSLYRLYEVCVRLRIPLFVDWGNSAIGIGAPGGGGVRLSLNNPMLLDEVAAEFPDLTIVGCHVAWPWVDEMLAVLTHKANMYCVLSGWYPKMFSSELVYYLNKRIPNKFMFGTEYPILSPTRWISEFQKLEISEESKRMVLGENARETLRLSD